MKLIPQGYLSLSTWLLLSLSPAHAQTTLQVATNAEPTAKLSAYWTPERFKAAKPMRTVAHENHPVTQLAAPTDGKPEGRDGRAPAHQVRITPQRLYMLDPLSAASAKADQVRTPRAVGNGGGRGGHYTSTRVFPMFTGANAHFSADRAYPYITVGKLFFSIDGNPSLCSGAVIQRRIVVTAASCVHRGTGGNAGFYKNFIFVPAYRDGAAPLMSWNWNVAVVHNAWAEAGGDPKNPANYAVLEFADQPPRAGGAPIALGSATGWLGWQTLSLNDNHTSKLGYACNLDNCEKMQKITSGTYVLGVPNLSWDGSDAMAGSEGSAWVQNFQVLRVGGGFGSNAGSNRMVGVTAASIQYPAEVQGASILDGRWISILNEICARRAGNCI